MKCANCNEDALYVYNITTTKGTSYCGEHLPRFLEARKKAGLLKTTDSLKSKQDDALQILSGSVDAPLVEETPPPAPRAQKAAKKTAE
jgi:hypothetical protein